MKKSELISNLQEIPEDLEILVGDFDHWFYNTSSVEIKQVHEGREIVEPNDSETRVITIS